MDFDYDILQVHLTKDKYVMIYPNTQTVCGCCFSKIDDIAAHTKSNSCCALWLCNRMIMYGFANIDDGQPGHNFHVEPTVVSTMLEDPNCPVNIIDITSQPPDWNPAMPFSGERRRNHLCDNALVGKSFQEFYEKYVEDNQRMRMNVPDVVHEAATLVNNYNNYPSQLQTTWNRHVDASLGNRVDAALQDRVKTEIQAKVTAGELVRRNAFQTQVDQEVNRRFDNELPQRVEDAIKAQIRNGTLQRLGGE